MPCDRCSGIGIVGGTGSRPYGAISGNVPYQSVLEFCKPVAGVPFYDYQAPPRKECGDYTRDLNAYPLNQPSTYQSGVWTFGASEMALVYLEMRDYPRSGGDVEFDFVNPAGQVFFVSTFSLPVPDPSWEWWFAFTWAVVGKFDDTTGYSGNEIITPGTYHIAVGTTWGSATIDYEVTGTPPIPSASPCAPCDAQGWKYDSPTNYCWKTGQPGFHPGTSDPIPCVSSPPPGVAMVTVQIKTNGNGKVFSSGGDNSYAERSSITVPQGYEIYLDAVPGEGAAFQKWANGAPDAFQDPFTLIADHDGSITAYFVSATAGCPRGDRYLRDLFTNCDPGYTLEAGVLQNTCICDEAVREGRVTPGEGAIDVNQLVTYGVYGLALLVGANIIGALKR